MNNEKKLSLKVLKTYIADKRGNVAVVVLLVVIVLGILAYLFFGSQSSDNDAVPPASTDEQNTDEQTSESETTPQEESDQKLTQPPVKQPTETSQTATQPKPTQQSTTKPTAPQAPAQTKPTQEPATPPTTPAEPPDTGKTDTEIAAPKPQTYSMDISNFAFSQPTLTIIVGSTVKWTNKDSAPHTVTSTSGSELASSELSQGNTYSHTFKNAGTFPYFCAYHPSMKGTVIVK